MDRVVEGATILFPPAGDSGRHGPGAISDAAFYNPAMALNRDLSVLLVEGYAARRGRGIDMADPLAGTGARSLRVANEVRGDVIVHANDADKDGVQRIKAGQNANDLAFEVTNQSAQTFLSNRRFDVVDLDPFGSPMPFLDAAVQATRHDGLLCLTATDTGALCGTYPKACRRRYGAEPLHAAPWRAEVGLRILLGAAVRAAGRFDRAANPVWSVASGHWMRVVVQLRDGRRAADAAARTLGFVQENDASGQGVRRIAGAGPLWWGPLHDPVTVRAMQERVAEHSLARPRAVEALMDLMLDEAEATPFWVPLDGLARRLGGASVPRRADFMAGLRAAGFHASRNHIEPLGVRTDAGPRDVAAVWRSLL